MLAAAGTEEQRERWLEPLASGEARGTLAVWDEQAGWAPDHSEVEPGPDGTLSCVKIAVPDAASADFVIVAGADGRHFLHNVVGPGHHARSPRRRIDPTRKLFRVELDGAAARAARARSRRGSTRRVRHDRHPARRRERRAPPSARWRWRSRTPRIGRSSTGRSAPTRRSRTGARRCCSRSRARGRCPTGPAGRSTTSPTTGPRAASMAKAYAGDAGFRVTASALQVHGGIGFTYEHDLHFFLKRAHANAHAFGDSRWHRDRVADLAGVWPAVAPPRRRAALGVALVGRGGSTSGGSPGTSGSAQCGVRHEHRRVGGLPPSAAEEPGKNGQEANIRTMPRIRPPMPTKIGIWIPRNGLE